MSAATTSDLVLDALGCDTRRQIVRLLSGGRRAVGEIAEQLPVSRPAVSKHLRLLESARLVQHEQVGTQNLFQLNPKGFAEARNWLDQFWGDALSRFALLAENTSQEEP